MYTGTWTRLANGCWGVKVRCRGKSPSQNSIISVAVKRRDGETHTEKVKLFWIGTDRWSNSTIGLGSPIKDGYHLNYHGERAPADYSSDLCYKCRLARKTSGTQWCDQCYYS